MALGRSLDIEVRGLDKLLSITDPRKVAWAIDNGLTTVAINVEKHAKDEVPSKTARLARTIKLIGARTGPTRTVAAGSSDVNYAVYVHEGTRPHRIPKSGKTLLAWPATAAGRRLSSRGNAAALAGGAGLGVAGGGFGGLSIKRVGKVGRNSGTYRYAMSVKHPGTKPNPFFERAFRKTDAGALMAAEIDKVFRGRK